MAESPLQTLLSFPPRDVSKLSPRQYHDKFNIYWSKLKTLDQQIWTEPIDKKNLLEFLNPEINTAPYIVALNEQTKAVSNDKQATEQLLDQSLIFFATFDPVQARYVGECWSRQLDWTLDVLRETSTELTPVANAILRLDPTAGTFTHLHLRYVRACLELGVPSQALPLLNKNIYAFPANPLKSVPDEILSEDVDLSNGFITPASKFTLKIHTEYVLAYYLFGGTIYLALRNYSRARLFFEYCVLTPSYHHVVSALQVEAYKRWTLLGLLAEGRMYPLPRTHEQAVIKSLKALGKPYEVLAEDFETRDWRKFQAEADTGAQIWRDDGNVRLVMECGDALLRYRVLDLQKTYSALPVSRVASHLGFPPDETMRLVSEMIRRGYLSASVTPAASNDIADAVLRFHFSLQGASSVACQDDDLEAQTMRIEDLVTLVRDADRRLQLTKEYVEYEKRQKRAGPDADLADQMDLTYDEAVQALDGDGNDEDIMAQ